MERWRCFRLDAAILQLLDTDLEEFRRRLRVRVRRAMRDVQGEGVGSPAFHIVEALVSRGSSSPSELASLLEVRTSTMAAHLDRLVELKWVHREAAATGSNRVRVAVTALGKEAHERYVAARQEVLLEVLRPLTQAQQLCLADALHTCVSGLQKATFPADAD